MHHFTLTHKKLDTKIWEGEQSANCLDLSCVSCNPKHSGLEKLNCRALSRAVRKAKRMTKFKKKKKSRLFVLKKKLETNISKLQTTGCWTSVEYHKGTLSLCILFYQSLFSPNPRTIILERKHGRWIFGLMQSDHVDVSVL